MRRLVHILLAVAVVFAVAACSVHKNTPRSRFWQSFAARYNTYYNGHMAFIDGRLEQEKGNHDDYTEPLPMATVGNKKSQQLGRSNFDRTVEKMEKTIKQHSIKAKPEWKKSRRKTQRDIEWLSRREYNPFLWKAWLMLGQAQFNSAAFDEAATTFAYTARLYQTQPAISQQARAWQARCYVYLGWMYDAEDILRNQQRDSIDYRARAAWDETMADYYLHNHQEEEALPYLRRTIRREHRKTQKARLWYIYAQALTTLHREQEAYKAYARVVRQSPPYELEFNARIAQTEVMAGTDYRRMISRLRRMASSDNNKEYLDQVYYAIGNIYMTHADTLHAIAAYEKGAEKSTRNGTEKGVLLARLGDIYWQRERYADAQRCYGECIGLLDKDRPGYDVIAARSKVLDELVPHTEAVHLQDSLQQLAAMPEAERLAAIDRVIEALKKKEKEEADKAREAAVEQAQQRAGAQGGRQQQRTTPTSTQQGKDQQWYFYNQMAVNQGKQAFMQQWGRRDNTDDWQRLNKTVVGLFAQEEDEQPADSLMADGLPDMPADSLATGAAPQQQDSLANDPHRREYYLAQIPFTEEQRQQSDDIIKDGLFNAGVIFKDKLDNLHLSEKQLTRLISQYEDYGQTDQALYHLFLLYSRQGRHDKADSCLVRMNAGYADSDYTRLLNDPYFTENARFGTHIEDSIYAATYDAFKADRHDVIEANARISEERFPMGENRPKFLFIHGLSRLNQGDAKGCTDDLRQVVEKYPQSEVTEMAGMIIKGVQQGRQLYGGKFDLDDIWSRRDITLNTDSLAADTLSADTDVPFLYIVVYQPDSLNENQLLYEMARFNFSNFLVRNFDLEIERGDGYCQMHISGFLSFDEARQYARQLASADGQLPALLAHCRSLIVSEHNLSLLGTRYSFADYDAFYEQNFVPRREIDEELLQIPEVIEQPEDDEPEGDAPADTPAPAGSSGDFDFEDLF